MADRNFSTKVIVTESSSTDAIAANSVDGNAVVAASTGNGRGVVATQSSAGGSNAIAGSVTNASNTSAAIVGNSVGNGGYGVSGQASGNSGVGLYGVSSSSTGYGLQATNSAGGYSAKFFTKTLFSNNLETTDGYGLILPNSSTGFPTGTAGQLYYHPTFKALFIYDGSNWIQQTTPSVSAFPSSPATNLVVRRSDRGGIEYQYDGTRWLTTTVYPITLLHRDTIPYAQTTVHQDDASIGWVSKYGGVYIDQIWVSVYQSSTVSTSVYVSWSLLAFSNSGSVTVVLSTTNNQSAIANQWTSYGCNPTSNQVLSNAYGQLENIFTSNGATGLIYPNMTAFLKGIG